jgi:hypothetical protein
MVVRLMCYLCSATQELLRFVPKCLLGASGFLLGSPFKQIESFELCCASACNALFAYLVFPPLLLRFADK